MVVTQLYVNRPKSWKEVLATLLDLFASLAAADRNSVGGEISKVAAVTFAVSFVASWQPVST
eukprot:1861778-Amphidinium_carterae.1